MNRILVVDDRELNRKLLRLLFEAQGLSVDEAADGVDAFSRITQLAPDLIVTDLFMPRIDGFALCHLIRSDENTQHIPVLVLSATYTSEVDEQVCLDMGADRYLRKPVDKDEILRNVEWLLTNGGDPHQERTIRHDLACMTAHGTVLTHKLDQKQGEIQRLREVIAGNRQRTDETDDQVASAVPR